jgi:hypothetical protein
MESLLAPWRDRAIRLTSPLGAEEALRSVTGGIGSRPGRHQITGRVTHDRVRLKARTPSRNSWRPVLNARVVPVAHGSELVGSIGTHPVVKVFTVLWLAAVGAIATANIVFAEGPQRTAALLLPWAMFAFGVGLNYVGYSLGRNDERVLLDWLAQCLHSSTMDS